jgi:hypothetical protein
MLPLLDRLYPALHPLGYRSLPYPHALPRLGLGLAGVGSVEGPRNVVLFVSRGARMYVRVSSCWPDSDSEWACDNPPPHQLETPCQPAVPPGLTCSPGMPRAPASPGGGPNPTAHHPTVSQPRRFQRSGAPSRRARCAAKGVRAGSCGGPRRGHVADRSPAGLPSSGACPRACAHHGAPSSA